MDEYMSDGQRDEDDGGEGDECYLTDRAIGDDWLNIDHEEGGEWGMSDRQYRYGEWIVDGEDRC